MALSPAPRAWPFAANRCTWSWARFELRTVCNQICFELRLAAPIVIGKSLGRICVGCLAWYSDKRNDMGGCQKPTSLPATPDIICVLTAFDFQVSTCLAA